MPDCVGLSRSRAEAAITREASPGPMIPPAAVKLFRKRISVVGFSRDGVACFFLVGFLAVGGLWGFRVRGGSVVGVSRRCIAY